MIVYQDAKTQRWAAKLPSRKLNAGHSTRSSWWNIQDLSQPGVLAGAVSTAIRADVIVVSVRPGADLPLPFYVWADSWLPHRKNADGKLIAVIGISESTNKESHRELNYLRAMARAGRMELQEELRTDRRAWEN